MTERIINKYKIETNNSGYVVGFYDVQQEPYDYEGQMADFPNATKGWTKFVNGNFVEDETKKAEIIGEEAKQKEIAELEQKLKDTDYIWNVIKEGDRTEEYYAEVIANRHTWRMRIRELEA